MSFKAEKTLRLIDTVMLDDQGKSYREHLQKTLPKMADAYRGEDDLYRRHLGASLMGRECSRELWYGFRWVLRKNIPARLLRLFNRGHLEEGRFLALLKSIGCEVWFEDEGGGQFKFSGHNGHFGSALDCVVRGIPDLGPGVVANGEFKTASDKVFRKIESNGVQAEKYEHFVQQQLCMRAMNLPFSLYIVVNKNNDSLYAEIIPYAPEIAEQYHDRAGKIIRSPEPPPQIHPSPGWYACKWCDFISVCKRGAAVERNCRTCRFAEPLLDGLHPWVCKKGQDAILDKVASFTGCDQYEKIPVL